MLGDADGAPVRTCKVVKWSPPPLSGLYGGDICCLALAGEGMPAQASPARLVSPAGLRDVPVSLFGYPGDPPRTRNGGWAEHKLRGAVGGGVLQLDSASESALRAQPGYSGSPVIISDSYGDAVAGMLAVASNDPAVRDAYAIPVEEIVGIWPEALAGLTIPACPYRGLRAFTRDDSDAGLFVGRETEVDQLDQMVRLNSLTMVIGPSGVGKSSLVTAGLMPKLERDGWNTTFFRPGQLPLLAMAKAILAVEQPGETLTRSRLTAVADQLRSEGLASYAAVLGIITGKPTLLYIDQFEETLGAGTQAERQSFLDLLLANDIDGSTGLHMVCTLRADFFPQLLDYPDCGPRLQDRILFLSPMGAPALERVIREPAAIRGVDYEPGLSDTIARDALAGGGLPLLEFALTELWAAQQRRRISYADYYSSGGVAGRLSWYAERVFADLTRKYPEERIRRVMLRLVRSRGGATEATRRIVHKSALDDEWPLVEDLTRRRLTVLGSDVSGQTVTAELAHEALIREWPRFETWVNDDASFLRWLVFMEEKKAEDELLSGSRLMEAQNWLLERPRDIPDSLAELIERSREQRDRLATEEELRRRREERYRALIEGRAQLIWVASPDGQILEDSPEWRWITGQSAEEFLRDGWLDSIHHEDRERVEGDWRECLRAGRIFDDRFRMRTRGGAYRHYDVRAMPIERDGKIAEWVGACTDVTGMREADEMRGRLTEQLSAAALRTARLQQVTSMLAEALTVEQVVEVITEVGRTAIGSLRSAVAVLDPASARLRVVNPDGLPHAGPDSAGKQLTLDTPSVMTRAIRTARPVLVTDADELRRQFEAAAVDSDAGHGFDDTGDERSWVGLPLLAAGVPLGALRFSFGRPRKLTEEERVFLEALAGQCALAVERAALYEREHATAQTLQRSLLPDKLPVVPGLNLEARYLPVTRNLEISGDWYDVFRLPDGRLGIVVGDVMGNGLQAAIGMGRVRNALRSLAFTDPEPAAVFAGLDRLLSATESEEQVTRVSYLVIDPATGEGLIGNAGHLPVLCIDDGKRALLDATEAGAPLGWPGTRRQSAFRLAPGGTAVFYSDGLVEHRVRGLDAGLDELVRVAATAPEEMLSAPGRLLQYLLDQMLAGHEQEDDVTMLLIRREHGA